MNRSQLVESVASTIELPKKQAEAAVATIFDAISGAMRAGDRVEIRGFGSFTTRHYDAYTGRNPKTGEPVDVPAKQLPYFKVGKELRERVNELA